MSNGTSDTSSPIGLFAHNQLGELDVDRMVRFG